MGQGPAIYNVQESTILHKSIHNPFGEDATDDIRQELLSNPICHGKAVITNPTITTLINLRTSEVYTASISLALVHNSVFSQSDHCHMMVAGQTAAKDPKNDTENDILHKIIAAKILPDARTLQGVGKSDRWLNAAPIATSGCWINAQEWRYVFCLRYARTPHDFPSTYDRCGAKFSIAHGLAYKSRGLTISQHNETCQETIYHVGQALSPSSIRD